MTVIHLHGSSQSRDRQDTHEVLLRQTLRLRISTRMICKRQLQLLEVKRGVHMQMRLLHRWRRWKRRWW